MTRTSLVRNILLVSIRIDIFLKIRQLPKELISNVNPLTAIFRNNRDEGNGRNNWDPLRDGRPPKGLLFISLTFQTKVPSAQFCVLDTHGKSNCVQITSSFKDGHNTKQNISLSRNIFGKT